MSKVEEALNHKFQECDVIFWYDEKQEFTEEFNALSFDSIEKIEVTNNQFEAKFRVTKGETTKKFLLYFPDARPLNQDNWLLDIELANHVFQTDQEAMYLQEIGLEYHFKELVKEHLPFFKAKDRRNGLKELLGTGDGHDDIRGKMLAVLFNTDYVNLNTFIHAHSSAFIDESDKFEKDLERFNLDAYYWGKIQNQYNYKNEAPSIYDFLLEVFIANFALGTKASLTKESRLILSLWKDTIQYRESFRRVSEKIADSIDLESKLQSAEINEIIGDDLFKLTDRKIIHDLVALVSEETISIERVSQIIKERENKFWFSTAEHFYICFENGAQLISLINKHADKAYNTFEEGIGDYTDSLFEIDLVYRKFIWNYRQTNQNSILSALAEKIEKHYSNKWLLQYNNNWQRIVDDLKIWPTTIPNSQQKFFAQHVAPIISKKQRLFVIISDALRYENGVELSRRLVSANRDESSIESMVSSLPSYTQLGMASLLPHTELSFAGQSDSIVVDGLSSAGIQGRSNILAQNSGVRATAIKAENFMKLNAAVEGRDYVKKYDLIYIYNDRIDKTGDDTTTETRVFDAVEEELKYLLELLKKISNMNGNNMIITSDHGYIYQNNELDESDFSVSKHKGTSWKENRRFVIGHSLTNDNATKAFAAKDLNIHSDADVLIPKSINRLRVKGAGSRFVHGGAALQEIVLPLIKVSKKRENTTSSVNIDIIKSTDRITTNILAVSFIQSDLVAEQMLPREIRAAIYAEDGERLSDQFKYKFDIDEGSERQREVKHRFQLMAKASGKYKNQRVKLKLEEPIPGSSKWKEYKEYMYTLNISFTNDFDDF
jgi:uncharacterized protein (TIGR02687 family)